MPFPLKTQEQARDTILTVMRNLDAKVDVATDSDNFIRASGYGSAVSGLYQFMGWGINQMFPDTADLDNLQRFASARNIPIVLESNAFGSLKMSGTDGAEVGIDLIATINGVAYRTTGTGTVVDGTVTVPAKAIVAGVTGNQPANMPCTLQSAPGGIDANAIMVEMGGGAPAETVGKLLARVLQHLRQPPAGGNLLDHERWALEVPGVTQAWGYPKRRGSGTMDVAILSNGALPTEALRIATAAYIEGKAPPYGDRMVILLDEVFVPVTATVELEAGVLLSVVIAAAEIALAEYFATLKPGDTVYRIRLMSIFSSIPGVIDFVLASPADNVDTIISSTQVQIPRLGAVSVTS